MVAWLETTTESDKQDIPCHDNWTAQGACEPASSPVDPASKRLAFLQFVQFPPTVDLNVTLIIAC